MNVANLELCKELYELSGWDGTHIFYDAENDAVESRAALLMHPTRNCPAYDLGYLLRKLEEYGNPAISKNGSYRHTDRWGCMLVNLGGALGDTPEDAACKLAIDLFSKGLLGEADKLPQKSDKDVKDESGVLKNSQAES